MMRAALPAAALAAALLLSGCSAAQPGIGAGTATGLQQEVQHIAGLAAAHRYPEALTAATTLRSDLGAAVETGRVPASRAADIRSALTAVEADLRTAARTARPSPSATPTPTATPTATPTRTAAPASAPSRTAAATPKRTAAPAPAPVRSVLPKWWKKHKGHRGKGEDD
jgi:predicted small secreted protein